MPIEIKTALIGIIAALVGAWAGAAISRKSAIDLMQRQEFNKAAAKLRASFAPALAMIYLARHHGTHDRPDDDKFIKDNLLIHASAVEEFRPFVTESKRSEYQQAWENYRKAARDDIYTRTGEEWAASEEENREVPHGEFIEKKIHSVTEYAELK